MAFVRHLCLDRPNGARGANEGELPPTLRGIIHDRSYEGTIPNIPLYVTRDMWMWDDYNIRKLAKYRSYLRRQSRSNLNPPPPAPPEKT